MCPSSCAGRAAAELALPSLWPARSVAAATAASLRLRRYSLQWHELHSLWVQGQGRGERRRGHGWPGVVALTRARTAAGGRRAAGGQYWRCLWGRRQRPSTAEVRLAAHYYRLCAGRARVAAQRGVGGVRACAAWWLPPPARRGTHRCPVVRQRRKLELRWLPHRRQPCSSKVLRFPESTLRGRLCSPGGMSAQTLAGNSAS